MNRRLLYALVACAAVSAASFMLSHRGESADAPLYHSPLGLALSADGQVLYVGDHTAHAVVAVHLETGSLQATTRVITPYGLATAPDGKTLYVASADEDRVLALDLPSLQVRGSVTVGRRPNGLTVSPDGKTLYCCNQFTDDVSVIDTASLTETARLRAMREPRFCALGEGGQTLVVANHLPLGSNLDDNLGAEVSLINLADGSETRVQLARGATDVGQVVCSPDGRWAYVIHVLARWLVPPTQLERGWVATNALTVIDVPARQRLGTVLLDDLDRGAANGYGLALSPDGSGLYATFSGTHEVQLIDTSRLLKLITEWPADSPVALEDDLTAVYRAEVRRRVPSGGEGPRGVVVRGDEILVGNYFSGTVTRIGLTKGKVTQTIALGEQPTADAVRTGEALFHDARACFQGWHSCATCHPEGRTDGLAWDLLNDGIGNPKGAKSLVLSAQTPPVMSHGVRSTMEVAVESGFKFIQFHVPTQEEISAVSAYITALKPERSPLLTPDGSLSEAAQRGKAIFESPQADCARCHPEPLFTDLHTYDVGTQGPFDERGDYDTPTLVELFRTAPYLHDGSATTIREVLKERNPEDKHGCTSQLTDQQIADLTAYLLSL